uniref:HHIP-like protein 1 n=1 Tax=Plectus sambesii TaxID=2011161 RepID=A0A914VAF0_9BILA
MAKGTLIFLCSLTCMWIGSSAHPQCLNFQAPFIPERKTDFCKEYDEYTCCSTDEVHKLEEKYASVMRKATNQQRAECADFVRNIVCAECDPYAAHIFDAETHPDRPLKFPGLCRSYCNDLVAKCSSLIPFLTSDTQLLASLSTGQFCDRLALSDAEYCYPDLRNSAVLNNQLEHSTSNEDGCLCVQKVATDLKNPTWGTFVKDDEERFFILEQEGFIWIYDKQWTRSSELFLDITDRVYVTTRLADERGLLGLAFHPRFSSNRRFFVYYTGQLPSGVTVVKISEFRATADRQRGDKHSEVNLIAIPKPEGWWNHNGGMLMFGLDGMLHAFIGDGGGSGDRYNNGQNKQTLLGSAIRLNVTLPTTEHQPYTIPTDNPFVNDPSSAPEIYAYGLRNAWRCSVDRGEYPSGKNRGQIICGDVGQGAHEEIDVIVKGGNYGWRAKEGFACYDQQQCRTISGDIKPIYAYPHSVGKSVTGGYTYRGCGNPNLRGLYIYGDYVNGRLFRLKEPTVADKPYENREIFMCEANLCTNNLSNRYDLHILSFAEDYIGEIYMLATVQPTITSRTGAVYRLVDPRRRGDPTACRPSPPI